MTGDLNTTFGHRYYLNFAAFLYDYAPHHNPEPYNFYFLSISLHKRYNNLNMHTKRNAIV